MRIRSLPRRVVRRGVREIRGVGRRVQRAWQRQIRRRLLAGKFASTPFHWQVRGGEAIVLMCLWNRRERLIDVLRQLDAQTGINGVRLYLWNNNRKDHGAYLKTLAGFTPTGALAAVDIVKSPYNLGSIARFYWARKLSFDAPESAVIVLDDDQDVPEDFVAVCLREYRPDRVSAFWAFRIDGTGYWDRDFAVVGGKVDHVGPGGMVCRLGLFQDPRFFTAMPERFWVLDDIWFTHFALRAGLRLAKLPVEVVFVLEETNQHWTQGEMKRDFYDFLQVSSPLGPAPLESA